MKKQIQQFILLTLLLYFSEQVFRRFVDRKVVSSTPKYSLGARDTKQDSHFFPCIKYKVKGIDLSSKLSLADVVNVYH